MPGALVVLDTNVLVAAIRSRRGASFGIVERLGTGAYEIVISVPLVLEYEDALLRERGPLGPAQIDDLLDYICKVGRRQEIFYLWRPLLRDPKDDMVAEVAVAGGAKAVVTHNVRDFRALERFAVRVMTPQEFLRMIGGGKQ